MNIDLLIGLTRLRMFVMFAGLAWVCGLQAPLLARLLLVFLAVLAVVFDGYVEKLRIAHPTRTTTVPPQRTHS